MAEKLALGGVREGAVVSEFVNLADVVQEDAGEEKVAVDLRIVRAHQVAGAEQRHDVVEQASDIRVVKRFCGGGIAVGGGDFGIGHEGLDQRLEMRILKSGDEGGQDLPELADVFGGLGQIVGKFDFRIAQLAQ